MIRIPGRIPIAISPFFWLTAGIIGWINSHSFYGMLFWIGIIFFSILIHELGHALTALFFGQNPRIELVAFGGATYPDGKKLSPLREFIVVLNGPIFGLMIFFAATFLLKLGLFTSPLTIALLQTVRIVNLFWTILNLLPVIPLDGGQLVRIACEAFFGVKGWRYSIITSIVCASIFCLLFFFLGGILIALLFFLFAFQSFDLLRKTRSLSESDRDEGKKQEMAQIERMLLNGETDLAASHLEALRGEIKKGMIYLLATQYLAGIKFKEGKYEEVYDLLKPSQSELSLEALLLLHKSAYEVTDYPLVVKLAGSCYQKSHDPKIALLTAEACAGLKQVQASIGWLSAAIDEGGWDFNEILQKNTFDAIRHEHTFKHFVASLDQKS